MAVPTTITDLSATIASNVPAGSDQAFPYLDDYLRAAYGFIRQGDTKAADVASAATVDLGAVVGRFVNVTGTTTITSFGTVAAGIWRVVTFTGALTLTHNATSLILPGAADITTVAGDSMLAQSLGSGNWRVLFYQRGSALQDASFRNKIINGNFDIWQRATSQTANGYGSDDRWYNDQAGSTKTHSRQAFTVGQTDVPGNPKYYSRTAVTSAAGAANRIQKFQRVEGVSTLSGKTVTLSFYAKADAAKNIAVEFVQDFGTGGSPSAAVTGIGAQKVALTTSWQRFEVTVAIPSITGKTLGSNGNDYLAVSFWFDAGSNYNARTATLGQQSGTFDIANVQVEEGSVATPFEQRPVGLELQLCQRYYEMAGSLSTGMVAYASGAFSITSPIRFCVPKRVSPNFSADVSGMATTAGATCSSGTVTSPVHFNPIADTQQARLIITHSGTAPAGAVLLGNVSWTADAEL